VQLVGSCYTDISRCTVKNIKITLMCIITITLIALITIITFANRV